MITEGDMETVKKKGVGIDGRKCSLLMLRMGMSKGWELSRGEENGDNVHLGYLEKESLQKEVKFGEG